MAQWVKHLLCKQENTFVWIMRSHRIVGLPAIPAAKGWDETPRESWLARLASSGWTEILCLNNKDRKTTEGDSQHKPLASTLKLYIYLHICVVWIWTHNTHTHKKKSTISFLKQEISSELVNFPKSKKWALFYGDLWLGKQARPLRATCTRDVSKWNMLFCIVMFLYAQNGN